MQQASDAPITNTPSRASSAGGVRVRVGPGGSSPVAAGAVIRRGDAGSPPRGGGGRGHSGPVGAVGGFGGGRRGRRRSAGAVRPGRARARRGRLPRGGGLAGATAGRLIRRLAVYPAIGAPRGTVAAHPGTSAGYHMCAMAAVRARSNEEVCHRGSGASVSIPAPSRTNTEILMACRTAGGRSPACRGLVVPGRRSSPTPDSGHPGNGGSAACKYHTGEPRCPNLFRR
jgi:hypothetical protein